MIASLGTLDLGAGAGAPGRVARSPRPGPRPRQSHRARSIGEVELELVRPRPRVRAQASSPASVVDGGASARADVHAPRNSSNCSPGFPASRFRPTRSNAPRSAHPPRARDAAARTFRERAEMPELRDPLRARATGPARKAASSGWLVSGLELAADSSTSSCGELPAVERLGRGARPAAALVDPGEQAPVDAVEPFESRGWCDGGCQSSATAPPCSATGSSAATAAS